MNILRSPEKAAPPSPSTPDATTASSPIKPTSCEGYVTKRGHFRKSWRVRYLVLDGYDSRTAFQSGSATPKGEFFLSSVEKNAYVVGLGGQDKPFGFKMVGHAPGKGFMELDVFVDTVADLNKWLEVAHNALERANKLSRAKVLAESVQAAGGTTGRSIFGFRLTAGSTSPAALASSSPEQQMKTLGVTKQVMLQDALKELESAKLIGREACNEIVVQGQKLDSVEGHLGAIESDLDHGDKLLRRLKSPMVHILARDLCKPPTSPTKPSSAYTSGVDATFGGSGASTGAAIQVERGRRRQRTGAAGAGAGRAGGAGQPAERRGRQEHGADRAHRAQVDHRQRPRAEADQAGDHQHPARQHLLIRRAKDGGRAGHRETGECIYTATTKGLDVSLLC